MKVKMFSFFIIYVMVLFIGAFILPEMMSKQLAIGFAAIVGLFSFWLPEIIGRHFDGHKK